MLLASHDRVLKGGVGVLRYMSTFTYLANFGETNQLVKYHDGHIKI